jgi:hypothetical protein
MYRLVTYKKVCQGIPASWEELNALQVKCMENPEPDCIYQIEEVKDGED